MAKKNERVSVGSFEKYIKDSYSDKAVNAEVGGLSFTVKPVLSLQDTMIFAKTVAESCFSDSGEFMPEVREFMIRRNILERYANFTMPQNLEKQYDMVTKSTPLIEEILLHVDRPQFNALIDAINEKIDAIQVVNESAITKQVNEMYGFIANLQRQFEGMFDGVDNDAIAKLVGALGEGGLDQDKLVKAYFDYTSENGGADAEAVQ